MSASPWFVCLVLVIVNSDFTSAAPVHCQSSTDDCSTVSEHSQHETSEAVLLQLNENSLTADPTDFSLMKKTLALANRALKQSVYELSKLEAEDAFLMFRAEAAARAALSKLERPMSKLGKSRKFYASQKLFLDDLDQLLAVRPDMVATVDAVSGSVKSMVPSFDSKYNVKPIDAGGSKFIVGDGDYGRLPMVQLLRPFYQNFDFTPIRILLLNSQKTDNQALLEVSEDNDSGDKEYSTLQLVAQLHDQAAALKKKFGAADDDDELGENDDDAENNEEEDEENVDENDVDDDDDDDDDDENLVAQLVELTAAVREKMTADSFNEGETDDDDNDDLGDDIYELKTLAAEKDLLQLRAAAAVRNALTKMEKAHDGLLRSVPRGKRNRKIKQLQKRRAAMKTTLDELNSKFYAPWSRYGYSTSNNFHKTRRKAKYGTKNKYDDSKYLLKKRNSRLKKHRKTGRKTIYDGKGKKRF